MKNKSHKKTPLQSVGNLSESSSTVKMAAIHKKMLITNTARARIVQIISINVACLIVIAFLFYTVNINKAAENMQGAIIQPTLYEEDNNNAINPKNTDNPIQEIEIAMERLLSSGGAANITSEDIQPQSTSDFLPIMQLRLMDLNYLEHDEPSTYYGISTELAVKEFQAQHGMEATGIVNYQALLLMFSDNAKQKVIALGDGGLFVESVQERLGHLGFDIEKTGVFDENTQRCVEAFQFLNGLPQTGNLSHEDETLLFGENPIGIDGNPVSEDKNVNQALNVAAFIETAYDQLGVKYVKGGKRPGSFDCSGLVYYCLNKSGFSINYMTSAAWRQVKRFERIEKMEDLQPGDICTFVGHVGIYIGYGKMIDASMTDGQVRISTDINTKSYWLENWEGGIRLPTQSETN